MSPGARPQFGVAKPMRGGGPPTPPRPEPESDGGDQFPPLPHDAMDAQPGTGAPQKSEAIAKVADGVVVGSAIVSKIGKGDSVPDVLRFVKSLSDGAHSV